jgi:hypothetical protein
MVWTLEGQFSGRDRLAEWVETRLIFWEPSNESALNCSLRLFIFGMYFGGLLKNGWEEQLKTNHTATDVTGIRRIRCATHRVRFAMLREVATTKCGEKQI